MLILMRWTGQALIIGDNIKITTLGIKGRQVKLGIEAPDDVSIHREEVYEKLKSEGKIYVDSHGKKLHTDGEGK